jgi:hypothetical protein
MTPPVPATARIAASDLLRGWTKTDLAFTWVKRIGFVVTSAASNATFSPQWLRSMAMPMAFISATTRRPNSVRPASRRSRQPSPITVASL